MRKLFTTTAVVSLLMIMHGNTYAQKQTYRLRINDDECATITATGDYWHKQEGKWRLTPLKTSSSKHGIAALFYAGITMEGPVYREIVLIEHRVVSDRKLTLSSDGQIVEKTEIDKNSQVYALNM